MKKILFITLVLLLTISCQKENIQVLKSDELEQIHKKIITDFSESNIKTYAKMDSKTIDLDLEEKWNKNLSIFNDQGIDEVFIKNGIDEKILEIFEYYEEYKSDPNIYNRIVEKYSFLTTKDAFDLFNLVETFYAVSDIYNSNRNERINISAEINVNAKFSSYSCALGMAGMIVATAGGAAVTGGASLVLFLVGKSIALASFIDSCT